MKTLVETSLFNLFASYTNGAGPALGELPAAYDETATLSELHKNRAGLYAAGLQRNG